MFISSFSILSANIFIKLLKYFSKGTKMVEVFSKFASARYAFCRAGANAILYIYIYIYTSFSFFCGILVIDKGHTLSRRQFHSLRETTYPMAHFTCSLRISRIVNEDNPMSSVLNCTPAFLIPR